MTQRDDLISSNGWTDYICVVLHPRHEWIGVVLEFPYLFALCKGAVWLTKTTYFRTLLTTTKSFRMHVTDSMRIISLCRLTVRQSRIWTKGIFITFSAVKIWFLAINLPWSLACLKPMIPFVAGPSSEPPLPMLAPLPPFPPPLGLFLSEMPRPTTGGRVGFKGGRGAWGGTSTAIS